MSSAASEVTGGRSKLSWVSPTVASASGGTSKRLAIVGSCTEAGA